MASINVFVGVGRIVRDVEVKEVRGGHKKATFTIAIETIMKGKEGDKKDVCFIDCSVWNDEALRAAELRKGAEVFVKGRIKLEKWTDPKSGIERQKHVLVADTFMHSDKLDSSTVDIENAFEPTTKVKPVVKQQQLVSDSFEEDLPF